VNPVSNTLSDGLAPLSNPWLDPGMNPVLDPGMNQDLDLVRNSVVVDSGLGSDLPLDLDWALDSDSEVDFSLKSSFMVLDSVFECKRGSVEKVAIEDASMISPVVDPASQGVMAAAVFNGVFEGPGEDPARVGVRRGSWSRRSGLR
jgi:hypothetical protein